MALEKRDIVEIIEGYLDLEGPLGDQARPYYRANCPFHDDSNPSFIVYPGVQKWVCHGCSPSGGDAVDFVARLLDISLPEAKIRVSEEVDDADFLARQIGKDRDVRYNFSELMLSVRLHKLLARLPYLEALSVFKEVDSLVEQNRYRAVNTTLLRYGV